MIHFENVLPIPLKETNFNTQTEIWKAVLHFEKGKKYLIKAPSGKGKSTFLHLLYGLRNDYEGNIKLDNKLLPSLSEQEWVDIRQKRFSIMFQNLRLFPQLTAQENILINLHEGSNHAEKIQTMAKKLGIADLLHKQCQLLSFGQQQRVAIIRALMQPFELLLLDEPFSHLDAQNIKSAVELIESRCAEQKAGLLLVSLGENYGFSFDKTLFL